MKKAFCRIVIGGENFKEISEKSIEMIQDFLGYSDEEFSEILDLLEIDMHVEFNITHEGDKYMAQCHFRVPNYG